MPITAPHTYRQGRGETQAEGRLGCESRGAGTIPGGVSIVVRRRCIWSLSRSISSRYWPPRSHWRKCTVRAS